MDDTIYDHPVFGLSQNLFYVAIFEINFSLKTLLPNVTKSNSEDTLVFYSKFKYFSNTKYLLNIRVTLVKIYTTLT